MIHAAASATALFSALGLLMLFNPIARRIGLLDHPNARKQHDGAVPLTGGLAIYLALWIASLLMPSIPEKVALLVGSAGVLVIVGALDDRFGLGVKTRLLAQALATSIMIWGSGTSIHTVVPGLVLLSDWPVWIGAAITLVAVVGLVNAFNMIDGIDGLAGCTAVIACLTLAISQLLFGHAEHTEYLLVFCAAIIGYLSVNLTIASRNKVFLGDAGSLLIGFVIAWAVIFATQSNQPSVPAALALWSIALPVWDTLSVMSRRMRKGLSPFHADRTHLHHICLRAGLNSRQALAFLICFSLASYVVGALIYALTGATGALIGFGVCGLAFIMLQMKIWRVLVWVRRSA